MSRQDDIVRQAAVLRRAGQAREAVRLLKDAGSAVAVRLERGRALRGMGKAMQAMAEFEAALASMPGSHMARTEIAVTFRKVGRLDLALSELDSLTEEAPQSVRVHIERCKALAGRNDAEGALAAARAGIAAAGPALPLVLEAARRAHQLQRPDEALEVLDLHPAHDDVDWRRLKGRAHRALGQHEAALGEFQAVARLAPTAAAACDIGVALRALGQVEASVGAFQEALRLDPRLARAAAEAGVLLRLAGRPEDAEDLLRRFVAANPDAHPAWTEWVRTLIERGRHAAARKALKSYQPRPGREARDHAVLRALLAKRTWRFDAAREALEDALAHEPGHAGCHQEIARLAVLDFDLATSRRHLARHLNLTRASPGGPGARNLSQSHVGRFINEFALEAAAADDLARLARQSPRRRLDALTAFVVAQPEHSGAAMLFLRTLRRLGRLESATSDGRVVIPARINHFWDFNPPSQITERTDSWAAQHPHFTHALSDNRAAADQVGEALGADARKAFLRARSGAHKADLFRLAVALQHGGVWADADDLCLGPVDGLFGAAELIVWQEEYGSIGNNFFAVVPGHPMICAILDEALAAVTRGDGDSVWFSTGPGLWSRGFATWLAADIQGRLGRVRVLQRHQLLHVAAFHMPAAYKTGASHWATAEFGGSGQRAA